MMIWLRSLSLKVCEASESKNDYLMYVSLLLGPPPGLGVVRGIEEDAENG